MGAERAADAVLERARLLQKHLCDRTASLPLPTEARDLVREIRERLRRASDDEILADKPHEIHKNVKEDSSPLDPSPTYRGIYGGEKDLKRTGDLPRFRRRDGAWFTFTITVRTRPRQPLELFAYDFELCFPMSAEGEDRLPRFVRFDLNQPGHDNEAKGMRCHMHPGHDDLTAPAPLMSPLEILDLLLSTDLAVPVRPRKA